MQMDEGLDTGGVLSVARTPIDETTTAQSLHDRLAELGAKLIVEALDGVAAGTMTATAQPEGGVTYAAKLARDEGRLDWRKPADELARMVRALNPWPGTWFVHGNERIKVLAAEVVGKSGEPGVVLDEKLTIGCGKGALRLSTLQRAGRSAMSADEFARGYPLPIGTSLPFE